MYANTFGVEEMVEMQKTGTIDDSDLTPKGSLLGIRFKCSGAVPNTFQAHRLLWFARDFELQAELNEQLLISYHEEGYPSRLTKA